MSKHGSTLIITSHTWARDSYSLFNYEDNAITKDTLKTTHSCYAYRQGENTFISDNASGPIPNSKYLIKVQKEDGLFSITVADKIDGNPLNPNGFEKVWLVIKSLHPKNKIKGYKLCEGDVIKFGRVKYRVKELNGGIENKKLPQFSLNDVLDKLNNEDSLEQSHGVTYKLPCRVCLSEVYTQSNPLISPCKCDGTMKYIHLKCLQHCLRSKLVTKSNENIISLSWNKLCCELCMKPYPYKLVVGQQLVELIEIPKPPNQYIILESLKADKNSGKGLHIISLYNNNSIKVGRSRESDLRISDISASRLHAIIKYQDGGFLLEDQNSKYGTLVQVKRPILLEHHNLLSVQCGRTMLTFTTKKSWSLIPSCFCSSEESSYDMFKAPLSPGKLPLLPINTGIPISINDVQHLLAITGMGQMRIEKYKEHNNVLYKHYEIGVNSSCEEEEDEESIERVKVALLPNDLLDEPMDQSSLEDKMNKSFS